MGRGPSVTAKKPERREPGSAVVAQGLAVAEGAATGTATAEAAVRGAGNDTEVVRDGFVLDFISGTKALKETPRELVRQRIARALFHEYGVSVDDIGADFPVLVAGRRRRVDLAIFASGETHTPENLQRVVVCRPEPKQSKRGAVKMRDY